MTAKGVKSFILNYRASGKELRQIGEELGVDYILEGTIRWDKTGDAHRVRINPHLIKVSDDFLLWAGNYERAMTQVFVVQSDIASRIAEALDVTLLEGERRSIERAPTDHLEAYQAYLRGRDVTWKSSVSEESIKLGIQMYLRAVELDPGFSISFAALSRAHSGMYHFGYDRSQERLKRAQVAVDRALELEPQLPEAHLAMAYYHYWGHRDHEKALAELAIAEKKLPHDGRVLEAIGFIWRRQGKFADAAGRLRDAFALSPRDAVLSQQMATTYMYMRKYAEAELFFDITVSLAPDEQYAYANRAANYRISVGDLAGARAVLESMPRRSGDTWRWIEQWWYERDYDAILEFASLAPEQMIWKQDWAWPLVLQAAHAHALKNQPELAREAYDAARIILERELAQRPDDYRIHSSLGLAYAGLGRTDEAIEAGRRGVELCPVSDDALVGPVRVKTLSIIYTMSGDYDAAVRELDNLLSIPSAVSVPILRLDPWCDPLRELPPFQELLEKHTDDGS